MFYMWQGHHKGGQHRDTWGRLPALATAISTTLGVSNPKGSKIMAVTSTEIKTAIDAVVTSGQSFVLDGIQYSAATLSTLWDMYQTTTEEEARTDGSRPTMRGFRLSGMGY
jgi:hypothetical protein